MNRGPRFFLSSYSVHPVLPSVCTGRPYVRNKNLFSQKPLPAGKSIKMSFWGNLFCYRRFLHPFWNSAQNKSFIYIHLATFSPKFFSAFRMDDGIFWARLKVNQVETAKKNVLSCRVFMTKPCMRKISAKNEFATDLLTLLFVLFVFMRKYPIFVHAQPRSNQYPRQLSQHCNPPLKK